MYHYRSPLSPPSLALLCSPFRCLVIVLQVVNAVAWFWSSSSSQTLDFDVRAAPPLAKNKTFFPDEYMRQMQWGLYRPGTYFGVKGRHKESLVMGLGWGSIDGKVLRHDCRSGELQTFGWTEHDGESYGTQRIEDAKLQVRLETTFVKNKQRPDQAWYARIKAYSLDDKSTAKERPVSLFLHFGVESQDGSVTGVNEPGFDWKLGPDTTWKSIIKLHGSDPVMGPFTSIVTLQANSSSERSPPKWHYVANQVVPESTNALEQAKTGVWNGEEFIRKSLRRERKPNSTKAGPAYLVNKSLTHDREPNVLALQLAYYPSAGLQIDVKVDFHSEAVPNAELEGASAEAISQFEALVATASSAFKDRLASTFPLRPPFDKPEHHAATAAAVSGLLGGVGVFRGRLLARVAGNEDKLERLPEAVLFSGVPSRSFFPRGFLWDEGFHGLLIARWQPRLFLDILAHWLEIQQATGWIPREVPLGAEQESRVPLQFLPQDPNVANPPSLLLPLFWLLQSASGASPRAEALANRAGLQSASELRKLVQGFSAAALPRLAAWFAFLDKSQKSSHQSGCYAWAGRTAAHCLASGLDDYPRGLLVNNDECHLDLQAWMTLFAGILSAMCREVESQLPNANALCKDPDWAARTRALNATLDEVFAPSDTAAPFADYLGKQPIDSSGKVVTTPPWRSDGRCGPEFPKPAECDPYGGAPCCSPSGWCGGSPDFCDCPGCRRFKKLEERQGMWGKGKPSHSPHLGYVSLFPVLLGLVKWDHARAGALLDALQKPQTQKANTLFSPFGVMSLSSGDPLFRKGEDYWRGKVWGNLNYLTISALRHRAQGSGTVADTAKRAFDSLRSGFVGVVLKALKDQRYFFENFDPATGEGKGVGPFTGWTTLVVLVMSDELLNMDLPGLLESGSEMGVEL